VNGKRGQKAPAGKKSTSQKKTGGGKGSAVAVLEEESDESEVVESTPSIFAAFQGGGSPEGLKEALGAKVAAIDAALQKVRTTYAKVTTASSAKAAQAALAEIQNQVDALEVFADAFAGKREALDDLLASDAVGDSDEMAELMDQGSDIDKELGAVERQAKTATARINEELTEEVGRVGIAEDALNAASADAAELNRLRGLWATVALAKGHYTKHQGDTHATGEVDYLTRAEGLNNKKTGGTVLRKTRGDGDTCTFDTSTGDFSVKSSAGKIRTFFRPNRGKKYYDEQ
jgi:hypothetical protein